MRQMYNTLVASLNSFGIYGKQIDVGDIIEILLIAVLLYYILAWMKSTRAWSLLKGLLVIGGFIIIAYFLEMTTILWIAENAISFLVIALLIVLQPELRKALEELGKKNILTSVVSSPFSHREDDVFSEKTINEIIKASFDMGKVRTGALLVIEQKESLRDYERTGIEIDGIVSSELLINIFEKNTPLHDGAVIVRGNRITAATCYLPLTDSLDFDKDLGTRHRAAIGISEVTDSLTIVVSEETGYVSAAYQGKLARNLDAAGLKKYMNVILKGEDSEAEPKKRKSKRKERSTNHEEKTAP